MKTKAVQAKGVFNVVATKTGYMLQERLPVDLTLQVYFFHEDMWADEELAQVRAVHLDTALRMRLVNEFRNELRNNRELYRHVGGTQWSIDLGTIKYDF